MSRKLILVRHGQSLWNMENRFTGLNDVDLSQQGIVEAQQAGEQLINSEVNIDYAFTSNLKRAIKTAEIITDAQKDNHWTTTYKTRAYYNPNDLATNNTSPKILLQQDAALNERDYGDLSGKNKAETAAEFGADQVHIWRRSYDICPPNGESLRDVVSRVGDYFHNDIQPYLESGNVLIAAHGNSLRALLIVLGVFDETEISKVEIPTGRPIVLHFSLPNLQIIPELTNCLSPIRFRGREILDSRGNPTVEVDIYFGKQMLTRESAPSGASTGTNEACELRDGGYRYRGKGVQKAVANVNRFSAFHYITNEDIVNQKKFDKKLRKCDGTTLKLNIGGNTTTALSFVAAAGAAKITGKPLFQHIRTVSDIYPNDLEFKLPTPMVNILNGGKHAGGNLKIQEFMIMPRSDITFSEKLHNVTMVYHTLGKLLVEKYGQSAKNLGDEGGFAPQLNTANEALTIIQDAIEKAGFTPGEDIFLALDCAASEFYDKETKRYQVEKNNYLNRYELCNYYKNLIIDYPALRSIEDPFDEYDYEGWTLFMNEIIPILPHKVMVVGDDLFTTNPETVSKGLENKWANSLLLKVNQIGTLTEAVNAARMMVERGMDVIVSHRSGETSSTFIADLAVGIGAKYIKTGAPARGERVAKYNRLLQIEDQVKTI